MISIDLETRSKTDLLAEGTYNYAACDSTDVINMGYSIDGAEPLLWLPGDPVPAVFNEPGHTYHAWNADFERLMWHYVLVPEYGFPPIPLEAWRCTMYQARANNIPGALGNAARCLNVDQQKMTRGKELIKLLSVPTTDGSFCEDPALLEEMDEYVLQDVRTEQAVAAQLRELTAEEWSDYHAGCRINDRGVMVDIELCRAAQGYAGEETQEILARIEELTDGAVTKARGEKLKAWVVERLTEDQQEVLVKVREGERKLSLDKHNRAGLAELEDISYEVREVVACSDLAQKSSVSKFRALEDRSDTYARRVRGAFMVNGASQSGRFSSKGAQVHNFPRQCADQPEEVREDMLNELPLAAMREKFGGVMQMLSSMLRPALIPAPGHVFLVSDWSAIEGRVAPWLCGEDAGGDAVVEAMQREAMRKLAMYANNEPVYELTAAATFNVEVNEVTKDQRQVGKVQELSFQFGGGAGAFMDMARNYGLSVTEQEAEEYKAAWRRVNLWAQAVWKEIEFASIRAVRSPGTVHQVGRLAYFAAKGVLAGGTTLFCQLPCGRLLTYPDARVELIETQYGEQHELTCLRAAFVPKVGEREWPRTKLWSGLLFENAVQGTAASLLRYVLRELENSDPDYAPLPVVMHVHDEVVVEVPEADAEECTEELAYVMNTPPPWAQSLPLAADVDTMHRYGK